MWDKSEEALTPDVSSLGVRYNVLYKRMSNVPLKIEEPTTKWAFGDSKWLSYVNKKYQLTEQDASKFDTAIVYQRKGPRGMATQMIGACDAVLLGIVNDRPSQSISVSPHSRIVNAPGLPPHFFSFPFSNFTYPVIYPSKAGSASTGDVMRRVV